MNYALVVSKYNENVDWLRAFEPANVMLYDKSANPIGIPRPNVGRESETYLYYILTHYDELPEYIVFLQGNPFDHMSGVSAETFRRQLEELLQTRPPATLPLFAQLREEDATKWPRLRVREHYESLFATACAPTIQFAAGCQYIVPRHEILKNSRELYTRLYNMICKGETLREDPHTQTPQTPFDSEAMCPWGFERFAYLLFTHR
jgi:hypothetical protein